MGAVRPPPLNFDQNHHIPIPIAPQQPHINALQYLINNNEAYPPVPPVNAQVPPVPPPPPEIGDLVDDIYANGNRRPTIKYRRIRTIRKGRQRRKSNNRKSNRKSRKSRRVKRY